MKNWKKFFIAGAVLLGVLLLIFIPKFINQHKIEKDILVKNDWLINAVDILYSQEDFKPVSDITTQDLPKDSVNVRIQFQKDGTFVMTQQADTTKPNHLGGKYTKKTVTNDGFLLDLTFENGTIFEAVCGVTTYLDGTKSPTLILTTDKYLVTFLGS